MKDGNCTGSPFLARVNQPSDYGASYDCITCLRPAWWNWYMPTNSQVSLSNPDTTKSCAIRSDQPPPFLCGQPGFPSCPPPAGLSAVYAECNACMACKGVNLCRADDAGVYASPDTCDTCVQCTDSKGGCGDINGRDGQQDGGHGHKGFLAQCKDNVCIQCNSSKQCDNSHCCWDKATSWPCGGEAWTCDHCCPGL